LQKSGPHHVGRFRHRDRSSRAQDQGRNLRFGHQRSDRQRRRRDPDTDKPHFLVDDHFLHDAARIVGNAAVVTHDKFEFSPGHSVAVLHNVKLERRCKLPADGVEPRSRQWEADTHLEDVLGGCAAGAKANGGAGRHSLEHRPAQHRAFPQFLFSSTPVAGDPTAR
jgi:hypothetical protein